MVFDGARFPSFVVFKWHTCRKKKRNIATNTIPATTGLSNDEGDDENLGEKHIKKRGRKRRNGGRHDSKAGLGEFDFEKKEERK